MKILKVAFVVAVSFLYAGNALSADAPFVFFGVTIGEAPKKEVSIRMVEYANIKDWIVYSYKPKSTGFEFEDYTVYTNHNNGAVYYLEADSGFMDTIDCRLMIEDVKDYIAKKYKNFPHNKQIDFSTHTFYTNKKGNMISITNHCEIGGGEAQFYLRAATKVMWPGSQ